MSKIKLQTDSILQVPLNMYQLDFTFNINGEEFQTTRFVADLLSPKISKLHQSDPTCSEYFIKTQVKGNFTNFLKLINFNTAEFNENEMLFIYEIIEKLGIQYIDIETHNTEITEDNVVDHLLLHEKATAYCNTKYEDCIDFISENFVSIMDKHEKDLHKLSEQTYETIFCNPKFSLDTEDRLLQFISLLYTENNKYSILFEYVCFENVDQSSIEQFITTFNFYDMTSGVWNSLCKRLSLRPDNDSKSEKKIHRYKTNDELKEKPKNTLDIGFKTGELKGIFSYFNLNSKIKDEVKVICSSTGSGGDPYRLLDIENVNNDFYTNSTENSWICFEFKNHQIIPSGYSIRSYGNNEGWNHPKSWVIEGSNDRSNWRKIDEQSDCPYLNGIYVVHTFPIYKQEGEDDAFKYVRIRQTGPNWHNRYYLEMCSIEFYGQII
ncbi:hypothetical protein M9Y10_015921 [Tritrichomonas musculus]|uniref:F5/8 type C domain-containing protein n=1 Tax=Tritrichomonas musculus TaxID=1915356 RepID=A0ABR2I552_9EUKA